MMKRKYTKLITVILLSHLLTSCTYLKNRGRDACDMVTLSGETGGVQVAGQISNFAIGAGAAGGEGYGLRSGAIGGYDYSEANVIICGQKTFIPDDFACCRGKGYKEIHFWIPDFSDEKEDNKTLFERDEKEDDWDDHTMIFQQGKWINYGQIEATASLGVGVRVGINIVEIADFFVGWTTLDICKDDIAGLNDEDSKKFIISQRVETR